MKNKTLTGLICLSLLASGCQHTPTQHTEVTIEKNGEENLIRAEARFKSEPSNTPLSEILKRLNAIEFIDDAEARISIDGEGKKHVLVSFTTIEGVEVHNHNDMFNQIFKTIREYFAGLSPDYIRIHYKSKGGTSLLGISPINKLNE